MNKVIYYFSGRGNSLSVARELAERIEGTRVLPMAKAEGAVAVRGGILGLVLPVIDFGLPLLVRDFVGRLRCGGEKPYVFAVLTCGGMPCAAMHALAKLLKKRGLTLAWGEHIVFALEKMPEEEWQSRLDAIASAATRREAAGLPSPKLAHRLMTGLLNPLARRMIPGEDRKFTVSAACDGCGVCQKVCPVQNIRIADGKPEWLHRCQQCAACFSWCPKEAISGTCLAARTHFRNPRVRLGEMVKNGTSA
jgi:ferredoxin